MKFYLLLISFLGTGAVLYAQKGKNDYAVSNNGDTVWGKYRENMLGQHIIITDTGNVNVKPSQYRLVFKAKDSVYYKPIQRGILPFEYFLYKRIVEGPIELYAYYPEKTGFTINSTMFFNSMYALKGDSLISVYEDGEKKKKRENIKRLIGDEPEVLKAFEETKGLNYNEVMNIIRRYNAVVQTKKPAYY